MRLKRRQVHARLLAASVLLTTACSGSQTSDQRDPFVSLGAEEAYEEGINAHRAEDYDRAEAAFRQAIEVNPRYLAAYLGLGRSLSAAGQPAAALSVYDDALTIRANNGEAHWGRSAALLAMERYDEAIAAAERARELGYEEDATVVLALAYEQTGATEEAIETLEALIRTNPGRTDLRIQLSRMYLSVGRVRDALPVLERAAFAETTNLSAWIALAELYHQLEAWDRAIDAWQRVQRMQPADAYSLMRQGEAQLMIGNHMVAVQVLGEAVGLDPGLARSYVLRGKAQVLGGFLDRGLADAQAALRIDPENVEALDLIAAIHTQRGSTDDAIAAYEAVIQANPGAVEPAVALARLHLEAGNPAAALDAVQPHASASNDHSALNGDALRGPSAAGEHGRGADLSGGLHRGPSQRPRPHAGVGRNGALNGGPDAPDVDPSSCVRRARGRDGGGLPNRVSPRPDRRIGQRRPARARARVDN